MVSITFEFIWNMRQVHFVFHNLSFVYDYLFFTILVLSLASYYLSFHAIELACTIFRGTENRKIASIRTLSSVINSEPFNFNYHWPGISHNFTTCGNSLLSQNRRTRALHQTDFSSDWDICMIWIGCSA